ncbi:hypothetical protein GCM10023339_01090 [Alloalcanivorax gelatiniphagus]
MPDRRGGPDHRATALLLTGAAALALVAGGLLLAGGALRGDGTSTPSGAASGSVAAVSPSPSSPPKSPKSPKSPEPARAADRGSRPEAVLVPSLGVRAPVDGIRTVAGALTPPPDPQRVGWWSGGARPGAPAGAAVITGHTVHTGGGAFDDLETLTRGDRVLVRSGVEVVTYEVASVEVLGRGELARRSASIFGRTGPGRLVLITCEDWDGTEYLSNVVVTARPV